MLAAVLEMIKFQHTLFALPFAVLAMVYAERRWPDAQVVAWILAAMAFNRLADRRIDARNPRTEDRALPRGRLSVGFVAGFTVVMAGLFVFSASQLKPLCFTLSPVALVVVLGYSYTKRFTWLSHFILGLALAIAPVGAWVAVTGRFDPFPIILGASVLLWVAGFDILYSLLDLEFDRRERIHSIPARFGARAGRRIAAALHLSATGGFVGLGVWAGLGLYYFAGCALVAVLLIHEHFLTGSRDPAKLNRAFFHVNAVVSFVLLVAGLVDLYD